MRLVLQVLGPPGVWVDGQPVSFRSRKSLALLVYLALQPGRHSRDALSALFWPESDSERGRATLRRTLALLRQEVGPALEPALDAERKGLALTVSGVIELDSASLDQAQLALRTAEPCGDVSLAVIEEAVGRYRGDFLQGFSLPDAPEFETWASTQREARLRQVSHLFDHLIQGLIAAGRTAIEPAARWVALDPLDEQAQRRLMEAHAAAGDRAGALAAYDQCRAVLARELDVEPDPETQALADRLRRAPEGRLRKTGDQTQAPASTARHAPSSPRLPASIVHPAPFGADAFVGRIGESQSLLEGLAAAAEGPRLFAITGESGIGKTRLAHDFVRQAAALGWEVMIGRALDLSVRLPYQAYVDALRERLARDLPPLEGSVLSEVSRLVPDLRQRISGLEAQSEDPLLGQSRLYAAIAELTRTLARSRGLVLVLDDAQ